MQMKWKLMTLAMVATMALTGAAKAQDSAPADGKTGTATTRRAVESSSQTDVGVSGFFAMTSGTSGLGTKQTPSNGAGGLVEVRHISSPLLGYELAYSNGVANQKYEPETGACKLTCQNPTIKLDSKSTSVAIDYVVSKKMGNLRPFAVAGVGFFIVSPGTTPYGNNTSIRGAYNYGGGVDYAFSKHLGVRAQFRGNLYKAPNTSQIYPATGKFTQSLEPMGGVFYRF